jgi:hypothetical protein
MNLFSIDIDWAHDQVIDYTLNLFAKHNISCTIFATHDSPVIKNLNDSLFEIAIHPNFNPNLLNGKGRCAKDIVLDLMDIYPDSKGVRSHSMTQSSRLLDVFVECNLKYESNLFLPYWENIKPVRMWNGLIRMPYNWEDDVHFLYGNNFEDSKINLTNQINVFDFHPIHLFLNTDCEQTYINAKSYGNDYNELTKFRNILKKGSKDLLVKLFESKHVGETITFSKYLYDNGF